MMDMMCQNRLATAAVVGAIMDRFHSGGMYNHAVAGALVDVMCQMQAGVPITGLLSTARAMEVGQAAAAGVAGGVVSHQAKRFI